MSNELQLITYYNFRVACGIIARSAGILQNVKKICLCSGKTLWEEKADVTADAKL